MSDYAKSRVVALSDVCELVAGYAFKSQHFGDYPTKVIKIKDIQPPFVEFSTLQGVELSHYNREKLQKYLVSNGDYVLAMTGATIGKLGKICQGNAYINQRVLFFRPKEKICDKRFLYYVLNDKDFLPYIINHIDSESAQPNISATTIGKYTFALPDMAEQKRIATFLSSLDDKIELNAQINHNLEEQAKAIFKSWFVDFEPFQDGEFVDSELGRIPQGWKVGNISDLGNVVGGSTPSKSKSEYYTSSGIPWITPKDLSINKSKFISHGEVDITPIGLKNSSATIMLQGTVLFSSRVPIGYIAIAKNEISTNQGFKSIVPFEHIGTSFVYCFLRENLSRIESMASGSTFKEISGSVMKGIPAIIPDSESLKRFSNICNSIFMEQEHRESKIHTIEKMRDTLLPKLMSGEIDVSEVEI